MCRRDAKSFVGHKIRRRHVTLMSDEKKEIRVVFKGGFADLLLTLKALSLSCPVVWLLVMGYFYKNMD